MLAFLVLVSIPVDRDMEDSARFQRFESGPILPTKRVSIVIPNYNGKSLLKKHLPYALSAAKCCPCDTKVTLVDDASTDGSADYVKQQYPDIHVIRLERNVGFAKACDAGIRAVQSDIVILLNTDVRVDEDFIEPLLSHFDSGDVFAVMAMSWGDDTNIEAGVAQVPLLKHGRLRFVKPGDILKMLAAYHQGDEAICSLYAVGGHCAIDRRKYLEIDGFDDLFHPFFWEDVDLCYRAWKRGWKTIFEPRSRVAHEHLTGTIYNLYDYSMRKITSDRNQYLFVWKNMTSIRYLYFSHIPAVFRRVLYRIFLGDLDYYRSLFDAVMLLPQVWTRRKFEKQRQRALTDEEIFARTTAWWKNSG